MAVILGRKPGGSGGGGGGPPTGAAGGVLSGTYPNPGFASDPVLESDYDANTVLAANTDNTPAAVTMGASTILARLAAGNIKAASVAEIQALIGGTYLIQEIVVGAGGLATIDFTGIPGTFRHLQVRGRARSEGGTATDIGVRFNNDSGNNYHFALFRNINATLSGPVVSPYSMGFVGQLPPTANAEPVLFTYDINYYATGTDRRIGLSNYGLSYASGLAVGQIMSLWGNTDAITRLTFVVDSGADFKEGSIFSLYGIY